MSEIIGEVGVRVVPVATDFAAQAQSAVNTAFANVRANFIPTGAMDEAREALASLTKPIEDRTAADQAWVEQAQQSGIAAQDLADSITITNAATAAGIQMTEEQARALNEQKFALADVSEQQQIFAEQTRAAEAAQAAQAARSREMRNLFLGLAGTIFAVGRTLDGVSEGLKAAFGQDSETAAGLGDAADFFSSLATLNIGGAIRAVTADQERLNKAVAEGAQTATLGSIRQVQAMEKELGLSKEVREELAKQITLRREAVIQIEISGTQEGTLDRVRALTKFAREVDTELQKLIDEGASEGAIAEGLNRQKAAWNDVRNANQALQQAREDAFRPGEEQLLFQRQLAQINGNKVAERNFTQALIDYYDKISEDQGISAQARREAFQKKVTEQAQLNAALKADAASQRDVINALQLDALATQATIAQLQGNTKLYDERRLAEADALLAQAALADTIQQSAQLTNQARVIQAQVAADRRDRARQAQDDAKQAADDAETERRALADAKVSRARAAAELTGDLGDDARVDRLEIAELRRRLNVKGVTASERETILGQIEAVENRATERVRESQEAVAEARIARARQAAERTPTLADDSAVDRQELAELRRQLANKKLTAAERENILAEIDRVEADAAERTRRQRINQRDRRDAIAQAQIERQKTLATITESTRDDQQALLAEQRFWRAKAQQAVKSGDLVALAQIQAHLAQVQAALANLKEKNDEVRTNAFAIFTEMQRTFEEFAPNIQLGPNSNATGILGRSGGTAAPPVVPTGSQGRGNVEALRSVNVTVNQTFPEPTEDRFREIRYAVHAVKGSIDASI